MTQIPPRLAKIIERLKLEVDGDVDVPSDPCVDDPSLVDMMDLPFVTIDNEDSRDLDQALYVERVDDGWIVRYAIADASFFVRPGTALFEHALARGASYYFPGFALPMLPRSLSEGIVSLNPAVTRRAVVFETDLAPDGEARSTRVIRARIESQGKLSFDGVQRWFDEGALGDEPWSDSLRQMRAVGERRVQRAIDRGVIEFDRSEAEVRFGNGGDRLVVTTRVRNDVERWNEQLSLLCNSEGARLVHEADGHIDDLQSVYRVHLPPLPRRLDELQRELDQVCNRHGLAAIWRWDGEKPLDAYLRDLPQDPLRIRRAIELQVRYTNRASEFSDRVGPHFALAVDQYARFSAPMREIVGIFTHKEALEAFGLSEPNDNTRDRALRTRVIDAANESKLTQKRVDKEVMLLAISDFLDHELEVAPGSRPWRVGTVIGLRATRAYVLLDAVPLELKLYTEDLETTFGCTYELCDHELRGDGPAPSFGLGDGVSLRVREYDKSRRRYTFDIRKVPTFRSDPS